MSITRHTFIRFSLFGGLAFLFLVTTFAILSRDNLFRFLNDPRIPFQTYMPPSAPDYSQSSAWALAPAQTDGVSIFVVSPTTYWGGKDWNTPLDAPGPQKYLWNEAIPNWAGPFQGAGQVSIPYYRSASLFSFLTVRNDARGARKLAFDDVLKAFDAFIAQTNGKGPIILAGAEQGGLHVLGLLQKRFDDPYLRERLAAAYVLDFAVPLDLFDGPLKEFSPCASAASSRCLITYGAFREGQTREIKRFAERTMVWDGQGKLKQTKGRALTCVNPVLGAANNEFAPQHLHNGAVAASGLEWGFAPAPFPEQTSTRCVDGILRVDRPKSRALRKKLGFGQRFKPEPFNLFYVDISRDVKTRIDNLNSRFEIEGRLAPPFENSMEIIDAPIRGVPGG